MWEVIGAIGTLLTIFCTVIGFLIKMIKKMNKNYKELKIKLDRIEKTVTTDDLNPVIVVHYLDDLNIRVQELENKVLD